MSYIVNKSDGNIAAVVLDGTINTTTSLNLVGRGYTAYGEVVAENLVYLLENFANTVAPRTPIPGQLWYDRTSRQLKLFKETSFVPINTVRISTSEPSNVDDGDFWFHPDKKQLFFRRGIDNWRLIAPPYEFTQGRTETYVETIADNQGTDHTILSTYVNNVKIGIFSSDQVFTPLIFEPGFLQIHPGLNLADSTLIQNVYLNGTALTSRTSLGLDAIADATYMHANSNSTTVGSINIQNDSGLTIGASADFTVNSGPIVTASTSSKKLRLSAASGASILLENGYNFVGINKTATTTLDVGGAISADSTITALDGFRFAGTARISSIANNIKLSPAATDAIILNTDGSTTIIGDAAFNKSITVVEDSAFNSNINVPTLPTANAHAANKEYVDREVENNKLPRGTVVMWYGRPSKIPSGWSICDGSNGTPDLRNKFIMGAGASVEIGATGGRNTVTTETNVSGGHTHTGTVDPAGEHNHDGFTASHALTVAEMPSHSHDLSNVIGVQSAGGRALHEKFENNSRIITQTGNVGGGAGHRHIISTSNTHVHTLTTIGAGEHSHVFSFDNRPEFAALYYIMKIVGGPDPFAV